MTRDRLKVVVTRQLPPKVETRMQELFDVQLNSDDVPLGREALVAALREADVVVPCISDRIDADLLEAAFAGAGDGADVGPVRCRLIANYGAGVDHIDVLAAHRRGIAVTNTPGVMTEDTADMAMALILSVMRRLPEGQAAMQEGRWEGWSPTAYMGHRVSGKTLGILGMGRIGQALARRAGAFGLGVLYHNRKPVHAATEEALGAQYRESLDQMVSQVDILSINCPHTPATYHLLNARRLKLMKPSAVIVNTSRGEVIDENALTRGLRAGEIAGAGLDVFEHGHMVNPRLRALPNVVLLPHIGSATTEGRIEMGEKVLLNIYTHADGLKPPDLVVPEMI